MKRFTETDKWRDTWYRKLKPLSKLAFSYMVDNCDGAGVWDPDFEFANFAIGEEIDWLQLQQELGDRLVILKSGKWFLTRFIEFQYGELCPDCRPHAKVLQLLKAHGLPYSKGSKRVSIPTGMDRTGKDKTGQDNPPPEPAVTADQIYAAYPRKEAKTDALKAIVKAMERDAPADILTATEGYAEAVGRWHPDDRRFVPHPATWFNGSRYQDDPVTWERRDPVLSPNGKRVAPARQGQNITGTEPEPVNYGPLKAS
jgi:hypothetical protein